MAVRKKSEIIHLRVDPVCKLLLESIANVEGVTATRVIERLITQAAGEIKIEEVDYLINESVLEHGELTLKDAIKMAYCSGEPLLTKLRLHYLAYEVLTARDKEITKAIVLNIDLFGGQDNIFTAEENLVSEDGFSVVPCVSLESIRLHMASLENYAEFKEKNPNLRVRYKEYLKISGL
ncbi:MULTISPECIES: hypothetical protein [Pseudomonas]|uniref:hypothetical protein n=1 Tax=Pseudomonas TaxID=286 RepID=UPI000570203B|nr:MULTISPECIES: hypothetical protein [Pseudomonas]QUN68451.1 hypothetical protein KDB76_03660 [Pseudomonas sp. JS425]